MTRRTADAQAFNQNDTGRMGFRHEWEPPDDRPLLIYPWPFWDDETERMTYEDAAQVNPRRDGEGCMTYLARVSAVVSGKYERLAKSMPHVHMSRVERDRQLQKLRGQLPGKTEIL